MRTTTANPDDDGTDDAKHPRGGNPANKGQFSEAGKADPGTNILGDATLAPDWRVMAATRALEDLTVEQIADVIARLQPEDALAVSVELDNRIPSGLYQRNVAAGVHGIWWSGSETEDHVEDWSADHLEMTSSEVDEISTEVNRRLRDNSPFPDKIYDRMRNIIDDEIETVAKAKFPTRTIKDN